MQKVLGVSQMTANRVQCEEEFSSTGDKWTVCGGVLPSHGVPALAMLMKIQRSSLIAFCLAALGRIALAQPEAPTAPRVFVCAHSFMIYTAKTLPPLAQAAGVGFVPAGQQMIGGSRVLQHWNLPDDKNRAKAALRAGQVDVLTLSPHLMLPDEGIDNFTKLGLEKNPKLRVLVQASWPPRDGVFNAPFKNEQRNLATVDSLEKMHDMFRDIWGTKLEAQVKALNQSIGHEAVFIVPAGDAVFDLREKIAAGKVPGIEHQADLFRDDLGHPQPALAELVTYCHFAAIYGRSPVGLPLPDAYKSLPHAAELNTLLQQIAWNAVSKYPLSGVKTETAGAQ
jgi:hypothetical protein